MIDGIPSSNSKVPIPQIRQAWQAGRRDSKSLLGPDCAHISALQMWHLLHLIFKPTVILYVGIWVCLKIWFTMVYPWYTGIPPIIASFWKGTWSSTTRFRGMVYKFYFRQTHIQWPFQEPIHWRYLVPIPYVRPKLSGNIPTKYGQQDVSSSDGRIPAFDHVIMVPRMMFRPGRNRGVGWITSYNSLEATAVSRHLRKLVQKKTILPYTSSTKTNGHVQWKK